MAFLKSLLLISILAAPATFAANQDEVLSKLRTLRAATDYTATGRLVRVSESGERKSFGVSLRAHAFPDGLRIFCDVTSPATERARMLLFTPAKGIASILTGHPGDHAPQELPGGRWSESVLGSDFTYEDLLENYTSWASQKLLPEVTYGARTCLVLRSEPGPGDATQYASITTWLDHDNLCPVKVEKVLNGSGAVRAFTYYGLRQVRGVWSASQIESRLGNRKGSSFLIVSRGTEKPHLGSAAFDPALLVKP